MNASAQFRRDERAVGWLELHDEATPNVLSRTLLERIGVALDTARAEHERAPLRVMVIVSAKEGVFSAGADLKALAAVRSAEEAEAISALGQRIFGRIAAFPAPTVAAIQGVSAGGGFELALACQRRLAADDAATRIGLTEVSLGTVPGWGGCVRLTQLLGPQLALAHILRARLLSAAEAREAGLVDEVCPAAMLRARAAESVPVHRFPAASAAWKAFADSARAGDLARNAAGRVVTAAARLPPDEALAAERAAFGRLVPGAECQHRLRAFFLRAAARKRTLAGWYPAAGDIVPLAFAHAGVVGAGVMGSGIAQALAARGYAVTLHDSDPDRALRADRTIGQRAAAETMARIVTTTDLGELRGCDLIIEAITEDLAAKQELFGALSRIAGPETVLASNTSALPIEAIARHAARPDRAVGLHFFNPVARMELVELVLGERTDPAVAAGALELLKRLGKAPVICRSSPGLLVTRILFFYLNAALRLHEERVPAERIDAAMRAFGWPMGPLRLIDEIGLDVASSILDELAGYFPGRFLPSATCGQLVRVGLFGRKGGHGSGFYRYPENGPPLPNPRLPAMAGEPSDLTEEEICDRLMGCMAEEAGTCLAEGVVQSADDLDFALISGAGYPAFRPSVLTLCSPLLPRSPRP